MDLSALASAIGQIFTPWTFFMLFTGTSLGIIVGAIPGITRPMPAIFTLMAIVLLVWPLYSDWRRNKKNRNSK